MGHFEHQTGRRGSIGLAVMFAMYLISPSIGNSQTLREAVRIALESNPRVEAVRAETDVARYSSRIVRSEFFPQLNLRASAGYNKLYGLGLDQQRAASEAARLRAEEALANQSTQAGEALLASQIAQSAQSQNAVAISDAATAIRSARSVTAENGFTEEQVASARAFAARQTSDSVEATNLAQQALEQQTLEVSEAVRASQEAQSAQAVAIATPPPTVSDEGTIENYSAVLSQHLFDGRNRWNRFQASKFEIEASREFEYEEGESLALEVIATYLELLRSTEQHKEAQLNLETHEEALSRAEKRAATGLGSTADVALVNARIGLAQSDVRRSALSVKSAEIRFLELIGQQPESIIPVEAPGVSEQFRVGLEETVKNDHVVEALRNRTLANEKTLKAARADFAPRLMMEVGVSHERGETRFSSLPDTEVSALLVMSWTFPGGRKMAQARREKSLLVASKARLEDVARQSFRQASLALQDYDYRMIQVADLEQYISSLSEVVDSYEKQLQVGQRGFLNILDIRNEQFRAKSSLLEISASAILAEFRLLASAGQLLEHLELNGE